MHPRRWYREPYVWLIVTFPLMAVIGGFWTLYLAIKTNDGLVVDDYYERGLAINQDLDREHAAAARGLNAVLTIDGNPSELRIALTGNRTFKPPGQIKVSFLHQTRSGFDRILVLDESGPGIYQAPAPQLVPGDWDVLIEAGDWRLLRTQRVRRATNQ